MNEHRLKIGDFVTCYSPGSRTEHESWTGGEIIDTIARHASGSPALHIVRVTGFKWDLFAPWRPYDGVPYYDLPFTWAYYLGRESHGSNQLEFVRDWRNC
jgi:hypothetical protein